VEEKGGGGCPNLLGRKGHVTGGKAAAPSKGRRGKKSGERHMSGGA